MKYLKCFESFLITESELKDDVEYKPWITDLVKRHIKELSKDSFQIFKD